VVKLNSLGWHGPARHDSEVRAPECLTPHRFRGNARTTRQFYKKYIYCFFRGQDAPQFTPIKSFKMSEQSVHFPECYVPLGKAAHGMAFLGRAFGTDLTATAHKSSSESHIAVQLLFDNPTDAKSFPLGITFNITPKTCSPTAGHHQL